MNGAKVRGRCIYDLCVDETLRGDRLETKQFNKCGREHDPFSSVIERDPGVEATERIKRR